MVHLALEVAAEIPPGADFGQSVKFLLAPLGVGIVVAVLAALTRIERG